MLYVLRPSETPDLMVSSDPLVGGWCTTSRVDEAFLGSKEKLSAIARELRLSAYELDRAYRVIGAFRKGIDCDEVPSAYVGKVLLNRIGRPFSKDDYRNATGRELVVMPQLFLITSVNHALKWETVKAFETAAETVHTLNDLLRNGRTTFRCCMVTASGISAWLDRIRASVEEGR